MTHTRSEILAMTPEQLRAEIAKRKGWVDVFVENGRCIGSHSVFGRMYPVPDYPNDIGAAWGLVEDWHKKKEVETIEFVRSYIPDEDGIYTMTYSCWLRHSHINAKAPTAPLAISRAWLIWSEESGE